MLFDAIPQYWLPVFIFWARICEVTLGTVRIIFVSRGVRVKSALLGFVKVPIWILVVAHLIQHLDYRLNYVAFAGGFVAVNLFGITLDNKMKVGGCNYAGNHI